MKEKFLIIPIFIPHLGCPHKCVFCNQKKITGMITTTTVADIKDTIEFFLKFKKGKDRVEVAFFGGTFTALPIKLQREFLDTIRPYIERGYIDYIRLSTRPDYITEEILSLLSMYNVKIIELGVQTLVDEILKNAKRGHTAEDVKRASKLIKDMGFLLGHQIMPGLPGDTDETIFYTVKESISMQPDIARIYPTLVIEETELYNMYKSGKYKPLALSDTIRIVALSYLYYNAFGVKIIRVGLQTTDYINEKNVIAGPYHPNIGEMVKGRIFLWMMKYLLKKGMYSSKDLVTFYVNNRELSYAMGYKKSNFILLRKNFCNLQIISDGHIELGEVVLNREHKTILDDFSKRVYKGIIDIDTL